jgi:type IV pilus assembly protein PilQ
MNKKLWTLLVPAGVLMAAVCGGLARAAEDMPASADVPLAAPAPEATSADMVAPAVSPSPAGIPSSAVPAPEVDTVPVTTYGPQGGGQNVISVSLDDVPLQDVVRLFTRISGANIVAMSSNLQGKVTVNLQDVQWQPALGSILDMYSMMISEKIPGSGIYSIHQKLTEPLVAQTIFLNYATVSNVITVVTPMIGREGSVSPFLNANALVVRASAANLNDVRKVITEIDKPRQQVYIEAKFLELTDSAIKNLGINWQSLEGFQMGVGSLQWSVQESRDNTSSRSDKMSQVDKRGRTDEINQDFTVNGKPAPQSTTVVPGKGSRTISDSIDQSRTITRDDEKTSSKTFSDIRTAVLSADDFSIVLSALKQLSGVTVVSNPKIIVANEETATIHIGQNEPNIKGTVTAGQQGQANTTTYALDPVRPYFEFGVSLEVTPTINNDTNITVKINPKLSRFIANKVSPDGNTFPIEATKTIKTVFSLENGKTAAIGGLTETDDRDVTTKIPLLGDIPLLGKWLFSHTSTQKSQTETIIFVTVGIANPHDIQRDQGLPEDAALVQKHLALRRAVKAVNAGTATRPQGAKGGTNAPASQP